MAHTLLDAGVNQHALGERFSQLGRGLIRFCTLQILKLALASANNFAGAHRYTHASVDESMDSA